MVRSAGRVDRDSDPRCSGFRELVFPDPDHGPAFVGQGRVRLFIAGPVGVEFVLPPVRIVLRSSSVVGATVPEAPVHIDGDSFTRENQVGSGTDVLGDPAVESVAITASVEFSSQCHFRLCIPDALGLETSTRCVVQRGGGLCGDPGRVGQAGSPGVKTQSAAA